MSLMPLRVHVHYVVKMLYTGMLDDVTCLVIKMVLMKV